MSIHASKNLSGDAFGGRIVGRTASPARPRTSSPCYDGLPPALLLSVLALSLQTGPLLADEDGYHPDIGDYAKIVKGREHKYTFNFGPTGLTGWFYDKVFVINGLDKGSPADGIVKIGDRVILPDPKPTLELQRRPSHARTVH